MELKVFKIDGSESAKTVTLDDRIFNVEPNDHAIWLDVKNIMANKRQGTHNTLERSTVSGSTRKLKRQKGTGGARAVASSPRPSAAVQQFSARIRETIPSS